MRASATNEIVRKYLVVKRYSVVEAATTSRERNGMCASNFKSNGNAITYMLAPERGKREREIEIEGGRGRWIWIERRRGGKRDSLDCFNRFGIHLSSNRSAKRYCSKLVMERIRAAYKWRNRGPSACVYVCLSDYDACFNLNTFCLIGLDTCCLSWTTASTFIFTLLKIALVGAC